MKLLPVVLGASAACGRIGFSSGGAADGSPASDAHACVAPVGHDEDLDGVDDACDVCPQIADVEQRDSDGDGVGDACDIDGLAEHFALFDPFTSLRPEWVYGAGAMIATDTLEFPAIGDSVDTFLVQPPAVDVFSLFGTVGAGGAGMREVALQIGTKGDQRHYYCELYDDGSTLVFNFTYTFDGVTHTQVARKDLPGRLENGTMRLTLVHAPPDMSCLADWSGVAYEVSGPIPAGIPAEQFYVGVNNVDATMESFARISTP